MTNKFDELNTVVIEAENTLNSRPLTYLSDENFQSSLTPNHLIHGHNINSKYFPEVKVDLSENDFRLRVKHLGIILKHFQNRFYKEYIIALREKQSYCKRKYKNTCPIAKNDAVLTGT